MNVRKERETNINPEDIPRCRHRHVSCRARRPPRLSLCCLSESLQGQLANDDSNDKEENAECQDAGAQAFVPHGRGSHGGGGGRVRRAHWGHLSLPQPVVLLRLRDRGVRPAQHTHSNGRCKQVECCRLKVLSETSNHELSTHKSP